MISDFEISTFDIEGGGNIGFAGYYNNLPYIGYFYKPFNRPFYIYSIQSTSWLSNYTITYETKKLASAFTPSGSRYAVSDYFLEVVIKDIY